MLFLHGMQSRYGNKTPKEIEDHARRYATAKGYKFEAVPVSGDNTAAQRKAALERIGKGGVSHLYGFSAGGYNIKHILGDKNINPEHRSALKDVTILGAPKTSNKVDGVNTNYYTDFKQGHMFGPEILAQQAEKEKESKAASKPTVTTPPKSQDTSDTNPVSQNIPTRFANPEKVAQAISKQTSTPPKTVSSAQLQSVMKEQFLTEKLEMGDTSNQDNPYVTLKTQSGLPYTVHRNYAKRFEGLVKDLETSGYKIKSIGGHANRNIAGTNKPSHHSYGGAIDINPGENPMSHEYKTDMPDIITKDRIYKKWGLGWGGDWKSKKDTMHFSVGKNEGGTGDDWTPPEEKETQIAQQPEEPKTTVPSLPDKAAQTITKQTEPEKKPEEKEKVSDTLPTMKIAQMSVQKDINEPKKAPSVSEQMSSFLAHIPHKYTAKFPGVKGNPQLEAQYEKMRSEKAETTRHYPKKIKEILYGMKKVHEQSADPTSIIKKDKPKSSIYPDEGLGPTGPTPKTSTTGIPMIPPKK